MNPTREDLLVSLKSLVYLCSRLHGPEATQQHIEQVLEASLDPPASEDGAGASPGAGAPIQVMKDVLQPQKFSFAKLTSWADQLSDEEDFDA